jgi:signal transduction histidine kinase
VAGDRKRLVQVLTNLLSNAAKYTPDGGTVSVVLEAGPAALAISVTDTGIGMTQELIGHAFDLFSQGTRGLDRSQGGLGIGLALVKSLLHLHGGAVRAHSAGPGTGSTFEVTLPRAAAALEGNTQDEQKYISTARN